jgi:hypothetical protein
MPCSSSIGCIADRLRSDGGSAGGSSRRCRTVSAANVPGLSSMSLPPRRMLPPSPSIFFCSGRMSITAVLAGLVELRAVGVRQAADVAGEFDDGHLEAEAQAQIGNLIFAGVADALDLAFGAADAEPAGNDDAVTIGQPLGDVGRIDGGGVDPFEIDVDAQMHAAMLAGLDDAGVGVAEGGVFAGDGQGDFLARLADACRRTSAISGGPDPPCADRRGRECSAA